MKRLWCVAVLPMLTLSSGCASHMPDQAPTLKLTGIVAKSTVGPYAFANFDRSFYKGNSFRKDFESHRPFRTAQYLKIEVSQHGPVHDHDFYAVFGPDPSPAVHEKGSARMNNSEPVLQVDSGWAYLDGDYPNANTKSDWVSTGAQGTKIVVRVDNVTNTHYVYLLPDNATTAAVNYKIKCNNASGTFTNAGGTGWFISIDAACNQTGPMAFDAAATAWINMIEPIFSAAE